MSENELQIALENHYKRFEYGEFWVDELNDDYVYIATPKRNWITDIECIWIARYTKKLLVKAGITLSHIHVGPFVWRFNTDI